MSGPSPLPQRRLGEPCVPGAIIAVHEQVVRVTAPNPSFMTGPGTNAYIVGDDTGCVVVDPGPVLAEHHATLLEAVSGRTVHAVAVTHHHRDHAPGARPLADAVGAPVVGHGHALVDVDVALHEGDSLAAGTTSLVAWHTPGHASDHLCYLIEDVGWLLTGDHLMQGSTVVIRPPDGDMADYLAAIERVRDADGLLALAPGHGRVIEDPSAVAADVIEHRRRREQLVLEALRAHGPATAAQLRAVAYADVGPERDEVATATCWAHLLGLVSTGLATSDSERADPGATFSPA